MSSFLALCSCISSFIIITHAIVLPAPERFKAGMQKSARVVRDVTPGGPEGTLSPRRRWQDAIGTAVQPWQRGKALKYSTIKSLRSGPISAVYRSALESSASAPCKPEKGKKCEVAIDGFGTVGEVQYEFRSSRRNRRGHSTQIMVACRCLEVECGLAVLIRPVNIVRQLSGGKTEATGRRTCLYEAVKGKFSDCHAELLRVSSRDVDDRPNYVRGSFTYGVGEDGENRWNATGQRGWTRDCLESDIANLPTVKLSALKRDDLQFNVHSTEAGEPHCRPPENVQYYRSEEAGDGDDCAAIYEYGAASAANLATQADKIAIADHESSYQDQVPVLVTDIELVLSCTASGLGLFFVWTMYRKQMKSNHTSAWILGFCVVGQVLSFALEALPLHSALGTELKGRAWASIFAFADATLALAEDQIDVQGSAFGSTLIISTVVGTVQYKDTREVMVGLTTIAFDAVAIGIIGATIYRKRRFILKHRDPNVFQET